MTYLKGSFGNLEWLSLRLLTNLNYFESYQLYVGLAALRLVMGMQRAFALGCYFLIDAKGVSSVVCHLRMF